jgi:hypothetical protein
MKLASHNSWSYLPPKKWWMKLIGFTAKCQDADIEEQYEKYGVRCFDLRISFNGDILQVNHGPIVYDITPQQLFTHLRYLSNKGDVAVRLLLDVRSKEDYTQHQVEQFRYWCGILVEVYKNIHFWCGRNLYNWNVEYDFGPEPVYMERYASVCAPKIIDDWYPRWYARKHTKELYETGTDAEYLMLDFVNYVKK